jgi:hypothetical protein
MTSLEQLLVDALDLDVNSKAETIEVKLASPI